MPVVALCHWATAFPHRHRTVWVVLAGAIGVLCSVPLALADFCDGCVFMILTRSVSEWRGRMCERESEAWDRVRPRIGIETMVDRNICLVLIMFVHAYAHKMNVPFSLRPHSQHNLAGMTWKIWRSISIFVAYAVFCAWILVYHGKWMCACSADVCPFMQKKE